MSRNLRKMTHAFEATESEGAVDADMEASAETDGEAAQADYSFDGYSVEFIDKVALMPISSLPYSAR